MGVLGLAPFLQKTFPEVIKKLPNRLKDLSGKTIVVDGTLITQRLHFAPMPHEYRHILGWYRLAQELRGSGVRPICVFDGKQRSMAKADEIERRRNVRRVDAFRGIIETDRLDRLSNLTGLLRTCRSLEAGERQRATSTLKTLLSAAQDQPLLTPTPLYVAGELDNIPGSSFLGIQPQTQTTALVPINPPDDLLGDFDDADIQDILMFDHDEPVSLDKNIRHDIPDGSHPEDVDDIPFDQLSLDSYNVIQPATAVDEVAIPEAAQIDETTKSPEEISASIAALYLSFRHSISKLDALPLPRLFATEQGPTSTSDDPTDVHAQTAMSKTQYQLAVDEGKLWESLAGLANIDEDSTSAEATLATLAEKSSLMAQSYLRRNNPPTQETFAESKSILKAMGVACVETSGPYEAEALASSLVVHGVADYVASEDMDVLVYEAPLIRNITSRREPLTLISGSEVRAVLKLDRAEYIDFAILLGTDFSQRIKNVGPQRALKFIREHGAIEQILEHEKQYPPRQALDTYLSHIRDARATFTTLPPVPEAPLLEAGEYDEDAVAEILARYGLRRYVEQDGWDYSNALDGNFFHDSPFHDNPLAS